MRTPVSLKHLDFFVKVVDCGGLSEAASQLNVSPSAVSKSLAILENTLSTTLIKRTTRSIALTEAGSYLYSRANSLLNDFDETLSTTSGYDHSPQGELRMTCSIAFGYSRLVNLVEKYRSQYPDVSLYIDLSDNFMNLNETDFDIALRISTSPPQNYAMRKLAPIRWVWCASPGYLAKKGTPISSANLVDHDCLIYPGLTPVLKVADEQARLHPLKLYAPIQANSSLVLLKSVLEDQGIACLPTYLIGDYIQNGEITPLVLDGIITGETHMLYALYFPSRYSNPKVRSFIDFLIMELGATPDWDSWISN
ncbi:LysR family transcriptional regulator [Pantoea ananatis]|uniref:LysR family transcriptional regulator n=1 Tax=Pantoea ananas TaxID=553 RepID=UPI0007DAB5B9|nr:LysR family transcriptional regulator [Pantoea ananatis]MCW0351651.1 HTH-type transcriptional regulator DmlR [Pantoea ananatis]USL60287.1 LysR family transcriptional regulator [Pantoea ananatis]UYL03979.1 LysR family transcriptional regulator [Pantoea ananatis]